MTKEEIIQIVEDEDVEFIRLQFTDMFGMFKNIAITSNQLEAALDNRLMFDGSSVEGFVGIEESDMYLHPDLDTFEVFPWRPQQGKVARLICDVYLPDGNPFTADPRFILKKAITRAKEMGFFLEVGPGYYADKAVAGGKTVTPDAPNATDTVTYKAFGKFIAVDENGNPTTTTSEKAGYFDVGPLDMAENVRRDIVLNLEDMGYVIDASHHETAPAQHEIDFKYTDAVSAADEIMTLKMAVKVIARRHGFHATFMPKPKAKDSGSGMHIGMILRDGEGRNVFEAQGEKLSELANYFIAGLLKYIGELSLLTNPIVNSYKRLVPGFDAPVYISWSLSSNRSSLIRVPSIRGEHTKIELRSPDSAANPYFAIAACLWAGLRGIEEKLLPPEPVNKNMFVLANEERENIESLPRTLGQSIHLFEKSVFAREILGEYAYQRYLNAKKREWEEYLEIISDWEIAQYLERF